MSFNDSQAQSRALLHYLCRAPIQYLFTASTPRLPAFELHCFVSHAIWTGERLLSGFSYCPAPSHTDRAINEALRCVVSMEEVQMSQIFLYENSVFLLR